MEKAIVILEYMSHSWMYRAQHGWLDGDGIEDGIHDELYAARMAVANELWEIRNLTIFRASF